MNVPEPPGPPAVRALVSPRPVAAPAACHALDGAVRTYLHPLPAFEAGRLPAVVKEAAGVAD